MSEMVTSGVAHCFIIELSQTLPLEQKQEPTTWLELQLEPSSNFSPHDNYYWVPM